MIADIVTLALGSGGAIATLAATLRTWIGTRGHRSFRVRIQSGENAWTIDAPKLDAEQVESIVRAVTQAAGANSMDAERVESIVRAVTQVLEANSSESTQPSGSVEETTNDGN